jgi:hypothetical protein
MPLVFPLRSEMRKLLLEIKETLEWKGISEEERGEALKE